MKSYKQIVNKMMIIVMKMKIFLGFNKNKFKKIKLPKMNQTKIKKNIGNKNNNYKIKMTIQIQDNKFLIDYIISYGFYYYLNLKPLSNLIFK